MRFRFLSTAVLLFGLTACSATLPPSTSPLPAAQAAAGFQVRDDLYFGMRKQDATLVTEAEWQAFVDSVVTPRFSPGLTVLSGAGQYQSEGQPLVWEPTKVLILIHPGGADAERHIREIAAIYCRRFDQESVMRITSPVSQDFLRRDADSIPEAGGGIARDGKTKLLTLDAVDRISGPQEVGRAGVASKMWPEHFERFLG